MLLISLSAERGSWLHSQIDWWAPSYYTESAYSAIDVIEGATITRRWDGNQL